MPRADRVGIAWDGGPITWTDVGKSVVYTPPGPGLHSIAMTYSCPAQGDSVMIPISSAFREARVGDVIIADTSSRSEIAPLPRCDQIVLRYELRESGHILPPTFGSHEELMRELFQDDGPSA